MGIEPLIIVRCPACNANNRIAAHSPGLRPMCGRCKTPLDAPPVIRKGANSRKWIIPCVAIAVVCIIFAITLMQSNRGSLISQTGKVFEPATWLTISYADLLDRDAIIRTGQDLASAIREGTLRNAVQPFVDPYSRLLPAAIEFVNGPDQVPLHSVLDFFSPGEREPAWVALLRGGRIHVVTDGKNHAKVFLLGDDPQRAYTANYSVIRHCLNMLCLMVRGSVDVEVFAYHNDYDKSELRLNTTPFSFRADAFSPQKVVADIGALASFFANGAEIQGAMLSREHGLVLYGTEGAKPSLAGEPITLADLSVAYRAVFHAGDNEAFISLDPHKDPTKATVNFGGFLENTRIGSVVLEADKRFKTITSGLDPNNYADIRNYVRLHVDSFMSDAERDLMSGDGPIKGQWIGTRFWYYPDAIGVDSDLNWEYAVLTNPRFTADAERSRDDFASPKEFEHKKRTTLSPSIRESIDNVNRNYAQYAQAFPELSELTTVARLMGLCSWLLKAQPSWLDLDELLAVELPPCKTEFERTQLIAATFLAHSKADVPDRQRIAAEAKVIFISPILDQMVGEYFGAPSNIAEYLNRDLDPTRLNDDKFLDEATRLFHEYRNKPVRAMLTTKQDVQHLASYAAQNSDIPPPAIMEKFKAEIAVDKAALSDMEALIRQMKNRINAETSQDNYNALVDRHNQLVDQYEALRRRLNASIDRYNSLDVQFPHIVEIGGGISLEPSKFAIRQNAASPQLVTFKSRTAKVGVQWTDIGDSKRWMRSGTGPGPSPIEPPATVNARIAVAGHVKRWAQTDLGDGSWRAVVRFDATHSREVAYDAPKAVLQVAEFTDGQLKSIVIAQRDSQGRLVFKLGDRRNILPPQDPPVWHSEK